MNEFFWHQEKNKTNICSYFIYTTDFIYPFFKWLHQTGSNDEQFPND